jgi:Sulfotransferase family
MNHVNQLPHFLCIGAQKAATSWLWSMLRQHPGIWMPPVKELHYFDYLYIPENRSWIHGHIKKGISDTLKWNFNNNASNLEYIKYLVDTALVDPFTEDWYKSCFDRPAAKDKILGDITPEYSTLPEEGITYIKNLLGPDLRLIYIIRNPLDRALSQLRMNLSRRGKESEGLDVWMAAAKESVIVQRGDYQTYIKRWDMHFQESNILYIPFKMVNTSPERLLKQIESFIGVSSHHAFKNVSSIVHKTKEVKAPDEVVDFLSTTLEPQSAFLKERFGNEFFERT